MHVQLVSEFLHCTGTRRCSSDPCLWWTVIIIISSRPNHHRHQQCHHGLLHLSMYTLSIIINEGCWHIELPALLLPQLHPTHEGRRPVLTESAVAACLWHSVYYYIIIMNFLIIFRLIEYEWIIKLIPLIKRSCLWLASSYVFLFFILCTSAGIFQYSTVAVT